MTKYEVRAVMTDNAKQAVLDIYKGLKDELHRATEKSADLCEKLKTAETPKKTRRLLSRIEEADTDADCADYALSVLTQAVECIGYDFTERDGETVLESDGSPELSRDAVKAVLLAVWKGTELYTGMAYTKRERANDTANMTKADGAKRRAEYLDEASEETPFEAAYAQATLKDLLDALDMVPVDDCGQIVNIVDKEDD